jgi:DNA-binding transcriptional LysR family regulator
MSINPKHLQAFVSVAEQRSFRRAAERLNTTQPNISTRIAALEARLGAKLMERDAGSVRLSPMGEALLPYARRVLGSIDELIVAAHNDALFEGVMRLGVTEMIANTWLGAFLKALKEHFPNVVAELTVDLSANLSDALFNRSLDLALQSGPFDRQIAGLVDLGSYPLIWVASPQLGVRDGALSLDDILAHPILAHARGTRPYEQLADHIRDARAGHVRLVSSSNMAACLQMAIDGIGITCMPEAIVKNEIVNGRLVRLRYPWTPDPLTFAARYHADTTPSYVAEAARMAAEISREEQRKIKESDRFDPIE